MTILIIDDIAYMNPRGFLYDGCHKIWLIRDTADMEDMRTAGWSDTDMYDIHGLPQAWEDSCPLRFIQTGDLNDVIPQGRGPEEARILVIDDIAAARGPNTINGLAARLLSYGAEYGGDTPVVASYGTDEAHTDYELTDLFAIENTPNEAGRHNMHYAADYEKPVVTIML